MAEIKNGPNGYRIDRKVAQSKRYQLYLCEQIEMERQCLLQIASATEHNGELQRAAYILNELEIHADELEKEYESVKADTNVLLNYKLGLPELVDSFVSKEQGGRQINIYAFRNVDEISRMVPLSNITAKDLQRIDLRTSAWIMGKLLKLLAFAHSQGISVGLLTGNNILIEPKEHYVVIFDWLAARINPDGLSSETKREEISQAAKAVIAVLGGNLETDCVPNDGDDAFAPYTGHIIGLAKARESDAQRAHDEFYRLIDSLWKREYYPFTSRPVEEQGE